MTRYQIFNSSGDLLCQADLDCRYPTRLELQLLDAGYRIYIDKRRLTRKEVMDRGPENKVQGLPRARCGG